jgi:ABC-type branched-subunit amino acid transport system ATPase component/branched-subunit amino acid ABC-type transport system permease component
MFGRAPRQARHRVAIVTRTSWGAGQTQATRAGTGSPDVSTLMPFIVAGLTAGAIYGLAGIGLVLTYKTSGVFNFAHGALATLSAYVFWTLHVNHGMPWPLAAAICILGLGPLLGLLLERLGRRLAAAPLTLQVAGTVGLLLFIEAVIVLVYNQQEQRTVTPFLANGVTDIAGTIVRWSDVITFAVAVALTVTLSVTIRYTRRGLAMRAVVDAPELLDVSGTSPTSTRRVAWILGAVLVSVSGVLFTPLVSLDPVQLTLLVVQAFGAAAIGRFRSLPLTFVGGLVVGVLASLATKWFTTGLLAGLPAAMPFLVLFVVILVTPRRYLPHMPARIVQRGEAWSTPVRVQLLLGAPLAVALVLVPSFAGPHLTDWTTALATTILFLSLGLLVRTSGQVSLCHISFAAIGAAAFSHLAVGANIPWFPALLLAGLIAVPIGALLAIPAIRLSGLYLALATFAFGLLLQYMFYTETFMFGVSGAGLPEPRPTGLGLASDAGFYRLVLVLLAAAIVGVVALDRTRLGRLLRGVADSTTALTTTGTAVRVTQVLVFCLSAFLASLAGALIGVGSQVASADSYEPLLSLTYFAAVVTVVGKEPWYALAASAGLILLPSYLPSGSTVTWLQLLFGAAAIALALQGRLPEVPRAIRESLDRRFRRQPAAAASMDGLAGGRPTGPVGVRPLELRATSVSVRFGGLLAVDNLDLEARTGQITGLIGPNGAGKTTALDVLSGLRRPNRGTVQLGDADVSRRDPSARARLGLGRTFQRMQLFDSLTVWENVSMGAEGSLAGANPIRHVISRRGDRRRIGAAANAALELCDLSGLASVSVGSLSTGHRRLVELSRCLAGPFRILVLDEPASGLDHGERERFGRIFRRVVDERGIGILLVEHDMRLVLDVCDDIFVLDFGKLLLSGIPAEIRTSPIVHAAYLGEPAARDSAATVTTAELSGDAR